MLSAQKKRQQFFTVSLSFSKKYLFFSVPFETDLAKAVADADFIIEPITEDPQAKIDFYTALALLLPEKTGIAANSSTLLPGMFLSYMGQLGKYLAIHFVNHI